MHAYFSVRELKSFSCPLLLEKALGRLNQSESVYCAYVLVLGETRENLFVTRREILDFKQVWPLVYSTLQFFSDVL